MNQIKTIGQDLYHAIWKKYTINKQKKKYRSHENDIKIIPLTQSEKNAIDDYYTENYGKKIGYHYHEIYKSMSGKFDVSFFPDDIYFSLFEPCMNARMDICNALEDKMLFPTIVRSLNVQTPKIIISNVRGINQNHNFDIISQQQMASILAEYNEIFVKPSIDSCGGKGCKIIENENGISLKQIKEICKEYRRDFIIQEVCYNHKSMSELYPDALNTFRIVTYIFNGKIKHSKGVMRVGRNGARVDNASSGGIFVGICDDGTLLDYAMCDFNNHEKIYEHPNSHIRFKGYKIERYPAVVEKAIELHKAFPQVGVINWDFTLDVVGEPLLIEANINGGGGVEFIQWSHGEGIFKDDMKDILKWLSFLNKMSKSQYHLSELYPRKH